MIRYQGINNGNAAGVTCALNGQQLKFNGLKVALVASGISDSDVSEDIQYHYLFRGFGEACLRTHCLVDYFRLGWNSIAVFEEVGRGLQLKGTWVGDGNKGFNPEPTDIDKVFTSASTYIVETCTYIHIKINEWHIIGHLDDSYLENGKGIIMHMIDDAVQGTQDAEQQVKCRFSRFECEATTSFEEAILNYIGTKGLTYKTKTFIRGVDSSSTAPNSPKPQYFWLHFEIGIYFNSDNKIKDFGDVYFYDVKKEKIESADFQVKLFEDMGGLMAFNNTRDFMDGKKLYEDEEQPSYCGSCIIY